MEDMTMKHRLLAVGAVLAGAVALPLAMAPAAHADGLRVAVNFPVYAPAPVYYYQPVAYVPAPTRVIYVPRREGWRHYRWREEARWRPHEKFAYYRW